MKSTIKNIKDVERLELDQMMKVYLTKKEVKKIKPGVSGITDEVWKKRWGYIGGVFAGRRG